ncbi:MAG: hypothetical protein ACRD0O_19025 [Acidimicrobiia bacterium]
MVPEEQAPDVEALVAQLRARVEQRRGQGAYPPGLEDRLASDARLLLSRRVHNRRPFDAAGPLALLGDALPLCRPETGSGTHRLVAALVERQTEGVLAQIHAFADPLTELLTALATAVEDLSAEVGALRPPLHAVIERQAVAERLAVQNAAGSRGPGRSPNR